MYINTKFLAFEIYNILYIIEIQKQKINIHIIHIKYKYIQLYPELFIPLSIIIGKTYFKLITC